VLVDAVGSTVSRHRMQEPGPAAVITDIHGNLPALQAALDRIEAPGIWRVFCVANGSAAGPTRTRSAR